MDVGSCTIYELSGTSQGFPPTPGCMRSLRGDDPAAGLSLRTRRAAPPRCSAGSSALKLRTGPGGVSAVSKRTVTTPEPEPQTQPGPISSWTTSAPGGQVRRGGFGQRDLDVLLVGRLAEEVLLDPVGQPGHPDPQQPDAAGGVEVGEQRAGDPADRGAVVGGAGQRARAAQGGEVVQPDLDRDRPPREAVLAQAGRRRPWPAGSAGPPSAGGR